MRKEVNVNEIAEIMKGAGALIGGIAALIAALRHPDKDK